MTHIIRLRANQIIIDDIPTGAHLTHNEEVLLRTIFSRHGLATYEYLLQALYGGRDEPDMKIIAVFAHKVRRKLADHAKAIETIWGRGFIHSADYELADDGETTTVNVDGALLAEVSYNANLTPEALVNRLLRAEKAKQWAVAA